MEFQVIFTFFYHFLKTKNMQIFLNLRWGYLS